jgi:hypothetical protein
VSAVSSAQAVLIALAWLMTAATCPCHPRTALELAVTETVSVELCVDVAVSDAVTLEVCRQ